jgi:hypothetical protein
VWGNNQPGDVGLPDRELRVLGRHRPRGHADLGDPLPVPPELADVDQPLRRGDDDLRRDVRRHLPGIHVGRVWMAYWLFPIPNQMAMWPNFRSPLLWDVFAVSHLLHDLAALLVRRDGARPGDASRPGAGGSCGSLRPLRPRLARRQPALERYEKAYLLLAALSTPLVLSVHSVVSFDFATSQVPGWHTTIFPPYFVAGAVFGGFAMVLTLLAVPARSSSG